jgi:methionyl aminopeptidase
VTSDPVPTRRRAPSVLPQSNDDCWCGSGRRYKRCHKGLEGRIEPGVISPMRAVPSHIVKPSYADTGDVVRWNESAVKSAEIIERMRHAGQMAADILRLAGEFVKPGMTTDDIDVFRIRVHSTITAIPRASAPASTK